MNCRSIIKELTNYLDEALDPVLKTSIEKHLEGCEDCRVVVDTTRKTIQIYRSHELYELPDDLRERLHQAILAKCRKC